jgi:CheY-like chemotaxis protein/HPt (histidine-containing phosphotransfer) domain-containing protein
VSAADGAGGESSEVELTVSVRDTGIGIPPDRRDQLFTSFGQLDASTTRKYGGTGLGLAISKRLVELMGGTLRVDSDGINGHGTTFQFTVRLGRAAADAAAPFQHIVPSLAGRRVLVVDDNATNRHILGLQLQTWGMLAVEAAVPGEALDLLRRRDRFDLVILDMQMPEMDGVALARAICGHRNGQRLPIIMLTSLGRDLGADAQAVKCFAGRLTKPVKASQLYDAILSAIVGHAGSAEDVNIPPERRPPLRQGRSLRILLAEDMEVNRRFALLALEELGYRASVADNGREVLRLLGEESFDVVLMDVRMPELDGMEATRQIRRQLTSDRQPYIIAMTANAMRGDREACQAAGMDDYLSKPVYLDELRAALERAADRIAGSKRDDVLAKRVELGGVRPVDGPVRRVVGVDGHHAAGTEPTLIQLYLKEAETLLERLRVASNREDQDGVREAAHALKGSSGYVGAAQVADACAAIERLVRTGEPVGESVLSEVERALQRFSRKAQTGANGFRVSPAGV